MREIACSNRKAVRCPGAATSEELHLLKKAAVKIGAVAQHAAVVFLCHCPKFCKNSQLLFSSSDILKFRTARIFA